MKRILIIAAALAVSACCTPKVIREPVEVKVPVPVPCLEKEVAKPDWLLDSPIVGKLSIFDKWNTVLRELEQRREYERTLEAAMKACVK